jgi:hypothetical protein
MPAEKGNKYYLLQSSHGRQKQFASPDEFWQAFVEYVQHTKNNPFYRNDAVKSGEHTGKIIQIPTQRPLTRTGFSSYIGMTWQGVENYGKLESHKAFFEVYTRAMQIIDTNQVEGAIAGLFNANIVARIQGIKEQTDFTSDNKPFNIILQKGDKDG